MEAIISNCPRLHLLVKSKFSSTFTTIRSSTLLCTWWNKTKFPPPPPSHTKNRTYVEHQRNEKVYVLYILYFKILMEKREAQKKCSNIDFLRFFRGLLSVFYFVPFFSSFLMFYLCFKIQIKKKLKTRKFSLNFNLILCD